MLLDLKELVNKYNLNIRGIVQIGGHYGGEIKTFQELSIDNILVFEPVPSTFEILRKNVGNKVQLVNVALGNQSGEIAMNIETANEGQSSSILPLGSHATQYPHIQYVDQITVQIRRLDEYLLEAPLYNMLCIDVQGYELEVLKGGDEFLKGVDYIMCEVNRDQVYEGCAEVDEIDRFLSGYGFERVETNWEGVSWGDAFYIKTKQ